MAAKGSESKEKVLAKLLEVFSGSFSPDGKEVRIDFLEGGEPVQLKLTITAVKVAIPNKPKNEINPESQHFSISDEERKDLHEALTDMGVEF